MTLHGTTKRLSQTCERLVISFLTHVRPRLENLPHTNPRAKNGARERATGETCGTIANCGHGIGSKSCTRTDFYYYFLPQLLTDLGMRRTQWPFFSAVPLLQPHRVFEMTFPQTERRQPADILLVTEIHPQTQSWLTISHKRLFFASC